MIKKVLIVQNPSSDPKNILRHRTEGFFNDRNIENHIIVLKKDKEIKLSQFEPDLIIVLGGDGTFLTAARAYINLQIPMVGVNTGHLGFLTRIDPSTLEEGLEAIIQGNYKIAPKMALEIAQKEIYALNDIVIKNSNPSKLTKVNVFIDDEFLAEIDADGLILATPTGSTAYNMACSGPIIDPRASVIAITPICPHSLSAKPIVVSSAHKITIESDEDNSYPLTVSSDGANDFQLLPQERIEVVESKYKLPFIGFKDGSFYDLLKMKLGWGINLRTTAYSNKLKENTNGN